MSETRTRTYFEPVTNTNTMNTAAQQVEQAIEANQYDKAAQIAMDNAGATMSARLSDTKAATWAKDETAYRPHWRITLKVGRKSYTFDYWDSVHSGQKGAPEPSAYSVIACLQWYEVGTFENFADEYGYDTDSRKAESTWKATAKQYEALCRLFPSEAVREAFAAVQ